MDYSDCMDLANKTLNNVHCKYTCGLYCRAFLIMCLLLMSYAYCLICGTMCKKREQREDENLIVVGREIEIRDKPPNYEDI